MTRLQRGLWGVERSSLTSPALPWRRKIWGVRAQGSISGFVLTQTMTLGESLANSDKLKNNSPNKNAPAPSPGVEEQLGGGEETAT